MLKKIISPIKKLIEKGMHGDPGNIWEYVCQYLMACGIGANIVFAFLLIHSVL